MGEGTFHCLVEHCLIHGLADLLFSAGARLKGVESKSGKQGTLFNLFNMVTSENSCAGPIFPLSCSSQEV